MKSPRYLQAHCQSPTSQRTDQKLQKSLHLFHPEKNFKIFSHALKKKLKHANAQTDTT